MIDRPGKHPSTVGTEHRLEAYATLARRVVALGSWSSRQVLFRYRSTLRKVSVA
jgi:hypothetical protein